MAVEVVCCCGGGGRENNIGCVLGVLRFLRVLGVVWVACLRIWWWLLFCMDLVKVYGYWDKQFIGLRGVGLGLDLCF